MLCRRAGYAQGALAIGSCARRTACPRARLARPRARPPAPARAHRVYRRCARRRRRAPARRVRCRSKADARLPFHQRLNCRGGERSPLNCSEQAHSIGCSSSTLMTVVCKGVRVTGTLPPCLDSATLALLPPAAMRAEARPARVAKGVQPRESARAAARAPLELLAAGAAMAAAAAVTLGALSLRRRPDAERSRLPARCGTAGSSTCEGAVGHRSPRML